MPLEAGRHTFSRSQTGSASYVDHVGHSLLVLQYSIHEVTAFVASFHISLYLEIFTLVGGTDGHELAMGYAGAISTKSCTIRRWLIFYTFHHGLDEAHFLLLDTYAFQRQRRNDPFNA
jgi:hypothetical protein